MVSGGSAATEALFQLDLAGKFEREAAECRARAAQFQRGAASERSVAGRIEHLTELGWRVLPDRKWPGSRTANLDFILVGPGGVVVLDAKDWTRPRIDGNDLYCGEHLSNDKLDSLVSATDGLHAAFEIEDVTRATFMTACVFTGVGMDDTARGVKLVGVAKLPEWIQGLPHRLTEADVERIAVAMDFLCPELITLPGPVQPAASLSVQDDLFDTDAIAAASLEAALQGPIESWMTYLPPDQNHLVTADYNGPARVRGPAGTGKTVVALHRAAYLARRSLKPILVVTFVKTLPIVMEQLCRRLAPVHSHHIRFSGLHKLAGKILTEAGVAINLDVACVGRAFDEAWSEAADRSTLQSLNSSKNYWREEIDHVIKGRAMYDFDEYAKLDRVGRSTALRHDERVAAWELYSSYQANLVDAGVHDFNDLLQAAYDIAVEDGLSAKWGGVIVDEVQDLNLLGFQLLHALAGDGPNRFFIVGDGQQSVYPGGFNLSEAGISIVGRSTVLATNYRNTDEILRYALDRVSHDKFSDLDGTAESGTRSVSTLRHGVRPTEIRTTDEASADIALVDAVRRAAQAADGHADIAVLAYTKRELRHLTGVFRRERVPHVNLEDYDGYPIDKVKVGTFKRAKGLDFRFVLLPRVHSGDQPFLPGESVDGYQERVERYRREVFVGMTRARDALWVNYHEAQRNRF